MLPLRDNIPSRTVPAVNYALILATGLVFLVQVNARDSGQDLVERFGMIPQRVFHPDRPVTIVDKGHAGLGIVRAERTLAPTPFSPWLTLLTCVFLHGGWTHLIGNLWFLHIFGDNVEDRLGHLGYLLFFVIQVIVLPAPLFLGIWFLFQFLQGTISVGSVVTEGVAWWAHIGGFVAGALIAFVLSASGAARSPVRDRWTGRRP
ncbi:MAG: rhomboid family intramembrane serine protease [Planctomycetes bacterium]|nr:rhomboid family intramembrane serine protease [Planctomycetota bacterium]